MATILEQWELVKRASNDFVESRLDMVVSDLKKKVTEPLKIGNMVYYYCKGSEGKDVPAYCYQHNYTSVENLLPIYDKEDSGMYGWCNVDDVMSILTVIESHLAHIPDMEGNKKMYYQLNFTKQILIERDETDEDYAGKEWSELTDEAKGEIIEKAINEIMCGDAPVTDKDLTSAYCTE